MLVASLLPATELEKRAGRQMRDHADELVEPVREPLKESAHDLGDRAKEAATAVGEHRQGRRRRSEARTISTP